MTNDERTTLWVAERFDAREPARIIDMDMTAEMRNQVSGRACRIFREAQELAGVGEIEAHRMGEYSVARVAS